MSVLLFDDDKLKCDNHKHAAVKICVEKDCMAVPNMCCNSCMEYIHSGHQIIERSQFVYQSNKMYQQIQDQTNALEGQAKLFEQSGNNMKRIFNGELEKIRLQVNRQIDLIRDKSNKLFDGIQLKAKKDIIKATTDARDSINKFKPKNLNNMSSEQIRQVVNLIWQKDYGLDRSKYKDFYGPLQQKIKEQLLELQVSCQEALESIQLEKEIIQYVDTNYNKIDTEQEELTREELLVNERDAIKQQLEQHLAAKNCTCKGCNKIQKVKAYYGYYYNKSLYSTHHELPISKCAKAQKYSLRMHEVVNQLYEMKYRDNPIEDCVDAYFIY